MRIVTGGNGAVRAGETERDLREALPELLAMQADLRAVTYRLAEMDAAERAAEVAW